MAINKPVKKVTRTISSDNLFTDSVELKGYFNCCLSGTWSATVTVQRSFDYGDTWHDVKQFVANAQEYGFEPESGVYYKIGVKTGDYTSGEIVMRLSQ